MQSIGLNTMWDGERGRTLWCVNLTVFAIENLSSLQVFTPWNYQSSLRPSSHLLFSQFILSRCFKTQLFSLPKRLSTPMPCFRTPTELPCINSSRVWTWICACSLLIWLSRYHPINQTHICHRSDLVTIRMSTWHSSFLTVVAQPAIGQCFIMYGVISNQLVLDSG